MSFQKVIVLGAGIAGLAAAIALTHYNKLSVQVIELRSGPQSIGGAINLTPNAMRYLAHLGVAEKVVAAGFETKAIEIYSLRTGKKVGEINYQDIERFKYCGRRVLRNDLLNALLERCKELGVSVEYGRKAQNIESHSEGVKVTFADGTTTQGDILIGADGIHSFTRTNVIEPERKPEYTSIGSAYGLLEASALSKPLSHGTTLFSGQRGSLLVSYYDQERTKLYAAVVMETKSAESREGWKVVAEAKEDLKANIIDRFGGGAEPILDELLEKTQEWYFWPVFKLLPRGKWFNDRCLLIGDAAHAMPPQGESIGLALEDVVLLSRIIEKGNLDSVQEVFEKYERLRRDRIEEAYEKANWNWGTQKDKGWLGWIMMEWMMSIFLWWTKRSKDDELAFDVRDIPI